MRWFALVLIPLSLTQACQGGQEDTDLVTPPPLPSNCTGTGTQECCNREDIFDITEPVPGLPQAESDGSYAIEVCEEHCEDIFGWNLISCSVEESPLVEPGAIRCEFFVCYNNDGRI